MAPWLRYRILPDDTVVTYFNLHAYYLLGCLLSYLLTRSPTYILTYLHTYLLITYLLPLIRNSFPLQTDETKTILP